MKQYLLIFILASIYQPGICQNFRHYDFLGAGHTYELRVTSSSNAPSSSAYQTIDGFPINQDGQLKDASRFLAQSTFGADMATIRMVAAMGYEAWLEEQFQLPRVSYTDMSFRFAQRYLEEEEEEEEEGEIEERDFLSDLLEIDWFKAAWMHQSLSSPDLLRHRISFILSQLMVVNTNSDFSFEFGQMSSVYYDSLASNAFSNYRKLIGDVSYSPAMGIFLSHYNNPKADPSRNVHPDENYAREIMQLFSIGLWELNPDGTRKYDDQGNFVPTYTNADIKEFAQVFTGLGEGIPDGIFGRNVTDDNFEEPEDFSIVHLVTQPLRMYDQFHDKSEKRLLNGKVLPAGQSGIEDIDQTLDHLSAHANTAPFICTSLIKFLTTSNPSPAYVERVSRVFDPFAENNFQAVIKAILLDPEARVAPEEAGSFGKLREPLVRIMNYLRAFPITANEYGDYVYYNECPDENLGQFPLTAPSVFNFFLPDYQPQGQITQQYMVAPEFQIFNATNAIGYVNQIDKLAIRRAYLMSCFEEEFSDRMDDLEELETLEEEYFMDYEAVEGLVEDDPDKFIAYLNILLANGLLSANTQSIILQTMQLLADPDDKLRMALYLIMISPDYAILK